MWVNGLGARPEMSIKAGYISRDMRISGRIVRVRSTEQSVGILYQTRNGEIYMKHLVIAEKPSVGRA